MKIEFTRQIRDTPVEVRRETKVERPKPPVVPGSSSTKVAGDPTDPERPVLSRTSFEIPGTPVDLPRKLERHAVGEDRDVIPIVRIAPDYPARAARNGAEGWVQIRFNVTTSGTVRDAVVVASEPAGEFEDAALKSIARWRYNPRIDGGVAVERIGLETVIRFKLGN
jgi:protein TonB